MALTGSLLDFTAADILQLIKLQSKDGELMVRGAQRWISVSFRKGNVVAAARSGLDLLDAVGGRLVMNGDLGEEVWAKARTVCQRNNRPLDEVLKEQDEAAWEKVASYSEDYIRETVLSLFGWREGEYTFEPEKPGAAPLVSSPYLLDADLILMEGTAHAADWARVFERIPSLSAVFAQVKPGENDLDDEEGARTGGLSETERRVLEAVDGERNVQQVADACFCNLLQACEALAWLVDRGMVRRTRRTAEIKSPSPELAESPAETIEVAVEEDAPVPARRYGQRTMAAGIGVLCLALILSCGWLLVTGPGPGSAIAGDGFRDATWTFRDHKVRQALGVYRMMHGQYPESLDQLFKSGQVADPKMFSGMSYSVVGDGYSLHQN